MLFNTVIISEKEEARMSQDRTSIIEIKPNGRVDADGQFINRSGLEIIASIISVAVGGERKTHIMYRVNLSHSQLQRYLTLLEISGLVRVIKDQSGKASIYEATERGMMFLRDYGRLESYFKRKDPMTNSNISSSLDQI